jgi:hypothetical protein
VELRDRVEIELLYGQASTRVLEAARRWRAQLILADIGAHGVLERVLGDRRACSLLFESPCPVWFVPTAAAPASTGRQGQPVAAGAG